MSEAYTLTVRPGHPDFLDLPWEKPIAEWECARFVALPRGLSRHEVRFVSYQQGVYVIKMTGDVRLTLCIPFDDFIEKLFSREGFYSVMFDLSETQGLDSTTLGLIAKLAVKVQQQQQVKPLVVVSNPAIERLLVTMGLDDVCAIIDQPPQDYCQTADFVALTTDNSSNEALVKAKVLESHCVLMDLNQSNHDTFKDLVQTLKSA